MVEYEQGYQAFFNYHPELKRGHRTVPCPPLEENNRYAAETSSLIWRMF